MNHKYFEANPTKEERKAKLERSFMDEQFQAKSKDPNHPGIVSVETPAWVSEAVDHSYRISKPPDKTPYQLFTSEVVKRCLEEYSKQGD